MFEYIDFKKSKVLKIGLEAVRLCVKNLLYYLELLKIILKTHISYNKKSKFHVIEIWIHFIYVININDCVLHDHHDCGHAPHGCAYHVNGHGYDHVAREYAHHANDRDYVRDRHDYGHA